MRKSFLLVNTINKHGKIARFYITSILNLNLKLKSQNKMLNKYHKNHKRTRFDTKDHKKSYITKGIRNANILKSGTLALIAASNKQYRIFLVATSAYIYIEIEREVVT